MLQRVLPANDVSASHNLVGQRLGRKGLETRERVLAAMMRLLHAENDEPITLSRVAREASIGMTTLYLYFPDIGDLLLAGLARVMESADVAFLDRLRTRWPDADLGERCRDFLRAHHRFWQRHARILHMRNACADAGDVRFLRYRQEVSRPLLGMVVRQMDGTNDDGDTIDMAIVVIAGFERIAAVVTNPNFHVVDEPLAAPYRHTGVDRLVDAEARLMVVAIRDRRQAVRG